MIAGWSKSRYKLIVSLITESKWKNKTLCGIFYKFLPKVNVACELDAYRKQKICLTGWLTLDIIMGSRELHNKNKKTHSSAHTYSYTCTCTHITYTHGPSVLSPGTFWHRYNNQRQVTSALQTIPPVKSDQHHYSAGAGY